ncbi:DNA repair protein RadC [uncultured Lutibacter sp.]|uniref:RadC family protein n=1 Tax=uncultured Lutibacter sp. TaxID=437739 RepID=UPI0026120B6C|nr:DNA repair protein RadC [uncultured Lutibacter sp.]
MEYENTATSIKSWAEDDRPREKLLLKGKVALSDAELIAILIGSGSRNESAVALAKRILNSIENNLNNLSKLSVSDLQKFKGIGEAKAISIITALELGRRRRLEEALVLPKITSSKAVFEIMQPIIGELQHEEFWVIYLNNSNKVLYKKQLSKGGLTGTLVDVRMVYNKAIEIYATALILCHNHPSGKLQASQADKSITSKMKLAGETLDIKVLDHIIITENAYFSFADENLI